MDKRIAMLQKKLEYASQEELLFILLNDTDMKFKKTIQLWKEDSREGNLVAAKVTDNLIELKTSLKTELGNEKTQEALRNISDLYGYMISEITSCCFHRDYKKMESLYTKVFLNIKNMFELDRKAIKER